MLDRAHLLTRQKAGEQALHRLPVFQHIGHARRCPCIVLQHEEAVGAGADQIGAADMRPDAVWRLDASHRQPELRIGEDEFFGDQPCARSEEHTSELQSLMRTSYAVFCLKKKKTHNSIYN